MKIMSGFILVGILLKVTLVMSDAGCDCSTLTFLKQIVQQEIFERKLEISMLRSELQKSSAGTRSIESSSMTGPDIITRVEKLEQIFDVLKNTSDTEKQGVENHGQSEKSKSSVNKEENLLFQTIVKQALKNEKLERMNFISHVKTQMDNLSEIVSDFKTTTGNFVNEQALEWSANNEQFEKNITQQFSEFRESLKESIQDHVMQTKTDMDKMRDDIIQFDKNTSNKLEMLSVNVKNAREADKVYTDTFLNGIIDNVTDVRERLNECKTAIGLHKTDVNNMKNNVESSLRVVEELNHKFMEHLKASERQFSLITEKVGTCRSISGDDEWKHHGNRCYHYSDGISRSWSDASETCKKLNGGLVKIGSKEENDYIAANIKETSWIGLHDTQQENVWQWNSYEGTTESGDFRNWANNEPNDAYSNEDCATIFADGRWNDFTCSESLPFVCEKDPVMI